MIIDLILDRCDDEQQGIPYNAAEFYSEVMGYGDIGEDITRAMDYEDERAVQKALCEYVIFNEYNPAICGYIRSRNWLE